MACAGTTVESPVGEIEQLLSRLADSDCQFLRNGTWYGPERARQHLLKKLRYLRDRRAVVSAEEFIAVAASASSISGKPYAVQCAGQAQIASAEWLHEQLVQLRATGSTVSGDADAAGAAVACLRYDAPVVAAGTLTRLTYAEPAAVADGTAADNKASYFYLLPSRPLCVAEGRHDGMQPALATVAQVQLVLRDSRSYALLRPYLGQRVSCRGQVLSAFSAHHHAPLLLDHPQCEAIPVVAAPSPPPAAR